jgi:hypothetical protein
MSSLKNIVLQIRYPYTAGVIMVIWLGSAALLANSPNLPIERFVITNCIASVIIALLGFSNPRR